jgi:hypothetical protein
VKLHVWLWATVVFLSGRPSHAASARVDISPDCGSQAEFDAEVSRRLSDDAVLSKTSVVLRRDGEAYGLRVEIGDEVRTLRDANCRELFRAAVVVTVAVAVSEGARRKEPEPNPEPASPDVRTKDAETKDVVGPLAKRGTPDEPPHEGEAERPSAPRSRPDLAFGASLGAGLSTGLLPKPAFALELEGRLEWKRVGLATGARFVAPREERDPKDYGVEVWALGADVVGLARPLSFLEMRLGFTAYRLAGTGIGSEAPGDDVAWVAGPMAGVSVIPLELPRVWLAVGVEGHVDLVRSNFRILEYGVVFEVPRFGTAALLRFGYRFF